MVECIDPNGKLVEFVGRLSLVDINYEKSWDIYINPDPMPVKD